MRIQAFITQSGKIIGLTLTEVPSLKNVNFGHWNEDDRTFEVIGNAKISRGRDMHRLFNRTRRKISYPFYDVTIGRGKPI